MSNDSQRLIDGIDAALRSLDRIPEGDIAADDPHVLQARRILVRLLPDTHAYMYEAARKVARALSDAFRR